MAQTLRLFLCGGAALAAGCTFLVSMDGYEGPATAPPGGAGSGTGGTAAAAGVGAAAGEGGASGWPSPCSDDQKLCDEACVPLNDVAYGCGAPTCDPCDLAHATSQCVSQVCAIKECAADFADCDGLGANGCETDLLGTANCGACSHKCAPKFICSKHNGENYCFCPNADACNAGPGADGVCPYGICGCGNTACDIGERCVAPSRCGP